MSDFKRSSKCGDGACVEVAFAEPVKSSFCGDSACLEMGAGEEEVVFIRNNTDPSKIVGFPVEAWRGFINEIRDGTTLIDSLDD
jgi:uncharacterized protein DUF397